MIKRARLARLADDELGDAVVRVDQERPGWGEKLYDEVSDALERIEQFPRGWQTIDGCTDERRFTLRRFPCVLVFVETETEIVITAVVYGGREPGYWRGRR